MKREVESVVSETDEASLNRRYFVALKAAAARSIPEACAKFGVDVDFAKQVADMTLEQIDRLAISDLMLFKPAIPPGQFIKLTQIKDTQSRGIMARLSVKPH